MHLSNSTFYKSKRFNFHYKKKVCYQGDKYFAKVSDLVLICIFHWNRSTHADVKSLTYLPKHGLSKYYVSPYVLKKTEIIFSLWKQQFFHTKYFHTVFSKCNCPLWLSNRCHFFCHKHKCRDLISCSGLLQKDFRKKKTVITILACLQRRKEKSQGKERRATQFSLSHVTSFF